MRKVFSYGASMFVGVCVGWGVFAYAPGQHDRERSVEQFVKDSHADIRDDIKKVQWELSEFKQLVTSQQEQIQQILKKNAYNNQHSNTTDNKFINGHSIEEQGDMGDDVIGVEKVVRVEEEVRVDDSDEHRTSVNTLALSLGIKPQGQITDKLLAQLQQSYLDELQYRSEGVVAENITWEEATYYIENNIIDGEPETVDSDEIIRLAMGLNMADKMKLRDLVIEKLSAK